MKPAQFRYHAPETLEDTLGLLAQYGEDAKILAGGQSLVPMMNFRLARPKNVVDINRVAGLDYIREENAILRIGALTRQRAVERSELARKRNPLLVDASQYIGHAAIRNRGTVCGSLAHADPAAEWPALTMAMDATFVIHGPEGERRVPAADFFISYFTTCLEPQEMLTEVCIPALPPKAGYSFLEVSRRYGDFALVGMAVWLTADATGVCTDCGIALTGVGPCPVRARNAERHLRGAKLGESLFESVAKGVSDELEPDFDIHASAEYRRRVAGVILRRGLTMAYKRMGEN